MRRFWGWYELHAPERVYLLEGRRLSDKQARSLFQELPRRTDSEGIVPFVIGFGYLSKDQMHEAVGAVDGVIP